MRRASRLALRAAIVAAASLVCAGSARALDKQGSGAHGGSVAGADSGFDLTGSVSLGVSLFNPSYAARPDNTGLTLFRYAAHADIDLVGRRLSIPVDVNLFTDRQRDGLGVLAPTELDLITGVTSTWGLGDRAALEGGVRVEHDRPVDRGGTSQTYADVRARLMGELPGEQLGAPGHDLSGWVTVGWFAYNPTHTGTYFARPDNTGRALLRYALHGSVELVPDRLSLALDGTLFTDARAENPLRPSELDLTPEVVLSFGTSEVHLAYERDMPLDRGGLSQQFVYVLAQRAFDVIDDPEPLRPLRRATPASP
jgi:hypothetical protein